MASEQLQLANEDEDPYKSEGHFELRIENLSGFAQEQEGSQRLNDPPVYVRGVSWKILAIRREFGGQKYLGYFLQCNNGSSDPLWSCSATAELKILTQREENGVDHVREFCHIFHAKGNDWGYAQFMAFEDLMNPDNGWYDERADSIVLAVELKADVVERVGKYIVVAENELKLDKASTIVSMKIGQLEWEFKLTTIKNEEKSLVLTVTCKDMMTVKDSMDERNGKVAMELFCYRRDDPKSEAYSQYPSKLVQRHYFTAKDNSLTRIVNFPKGCDNILLTIRLLKQRSQFPDFTKPTAKVGCIPADTKLRVGDRTFHVNKQLLSFCSDYFDRMFNGGYKEANQVEIELKHEEANDPALFHDFLLIMFIPEVLPDSENMVGLLKLAQHYQAEEVTEKCMRHLRMCREMPVERRVLLAGEYGDEESQAAILNNLSNAEEKRIIKVLFKKLFLPYAPQQPQNEAE